MMMKQMIIGIAILGLSLSCSKEEPILQQPNQETTKPAKEEPNKEEPKGEAPQQNEPQSEAPQHGESQPDKPNNSEQNNPPADNAQNEGNRPSTYHVAKRMQARWKVTEEQYLSNIDLDALHINNEPQKFTAQYLAPFVEFYSTSVDGVVYKLTPQEVDELNILDIKYNGSSIRFKTSFRNITSQDTHSLPVDKLKYYDAKVQVTNAAAAQWYLFGVSQSENLALYLTDYLQYDEDKYAAIAQGTVPNVSSNSLTIYFNLTDKKSEKVLAMLQKTITGFRPLANIQQDLYAVSSYELVEYLKDRTKNLEGQRLNDRLKATLPTWIKKVDFYHNNPSIHLAWEKMDVDGGSTDVLNGRDGSKRYMHLYFKNPRFEFVSADKVGKNLVIKIRMTFINDETIDNAVYTLNAPIYYN